MDDILSVMGTYGEDIAAAMIVQIKAEMAARDWNRAELAKQSGISTSSMYRYLDGERQMKLQDIADIAAALSMSYLELATRAQRRLDAEDVR
jgi:transcriptional regulator with XRE-family HTH domain